jgi:phage terminase small subunit
LKNQYNLTRREFKLCEYYLQMGNATQAAIKAGYSDKSARTVASQVLAKSNVRAYLDMRIKEQDSALIADTNEALRFMTRMMRGEIEEEQVVTVLDGVGSSKAVVAIRKASARDRNVAAAKIIDTQTKINIPSSKQKELQEWDEEINIHIATLDALKKDRKVEGFDDDSNNNG